MTFVKLFKNRIFFVISQEGRLKTDNRTVKVVNTYLVCFSTTCRCILCYTSLHVTYNGLYLIKPIDINKSFEPSDELKRYIEHAKAMSKIKWM